MYFINKKRNQIKHLSFSDNLVLPAEGIKLNHESANYDPFSLYRKRYLKYSKSLHGKKNTISSFSSGLDNLQYSKFLQITGDSLEYFVRQHGILTLVIGVSGDLDSSFSLLALARIIKERNLSCEIVVYHFKKNFQPKRAKRIERILSYISSVYIPITFFSYDISLSSKLLHSEIEIFESNKIRPKKKEQIDRFNDILESSKDVFDISNKNINQTPIRERAPMMHELSTAIKGRLLRNFPRSALVGATNASEICFSNFTTSDVLVSFYPLVFLQKTSIIKMFREVIEESRGGIKYKDWEFILTSLTPFYPAKLEFKYSNTFDLEIKRVQHRYDFLSEVSVPQEVLQLNEKLWSAFVKKDESSPVPGIVQIELAKYSHHFLVNGISRKLIESLVKKFPDQKYEILLAAILFLAARELTIKDMYVAKLYI